MALDRYPTTQPPTATYPIHALCNNSKCTNLDQEVIEQFKIRELCEGCGLYRDAAEWENYRTLFFPDAYITTSWKQGPVDDFILASKEGFAKGFSSFMYILHRVIGSTVDINPGLTQAVCKMKVTITCRFTFDGVEMDNEADCRFFFLLEKRGPRWGVCFFTLLFDNDRFVAVNPGRTFGVPEEEAEGFPGGYRYLAWAESKIGVVPKLNLDSHGPERDVLYRKCGDWLEGRVVKPDLMGEDIEGWKA
ncbi:hypothetical protein BBP40_007817 [Aspergillus hancockii]|nr:hypothetical protein BBP40_007817 [Aspergillus hancockii]